ncbi:MAG TPA: hypothetical protein VMR34_05755 [Candidatus Saccharimonadales bacterium]|nr:hypothetical protein [Candidatus Saccharimonadales bacterium]
MTTLTLERESAIFGCLQPEEVIEQNERIIDGFTAELGGSQTRVLMESTIHALVLKALTEEA